MAAPQVTDTSLCDYSERARAIDQLLLFLDNSRRPSQRPLTTGGSMEARPRRQHRCRREPFLCPSFGTVDQILVPSVKSPAGLGVTASGQWGTVKLFQPEVA